MLVLTRKKNEGIRIGDNIRVVVEGVRGDKVRLSIVAPITISVHREEVYQAIKLERAVRLNDLEWVEFQKNVLIKCEDGRWSVGVGTVSWYGLTFQEALATCRKNIQNEK